MGVSRFLPKWTKNQVLLVPEDQSERLRSIEVIVNFWELLTAGEVGQIGAFYFPNMKYEEYWFHLHFFTCHIWNMREVLV
jgi:hypothetical protein